MKNLKFATLFSILIIALFFILAYSKQTAVAHNNLQTPSQTLSPIWNPNIQQWSAEIIQVADVYGLDPDFVAAVINAESNGNPTGISRAGAVGLMGVMPSGPGLEWRPSVEELQQPNINLRWGVGILSETIRQSGGDINAALAAYSAGWDQAHRTVPQEYADNVLNDYGRAVAARSGISPDIASQWTVAIEMRRGYVPFETLLMNQQPVSGLYMYGEHVVYNYVDQAGRQFYIKGYAVPLALVVPATHDQPAPLDSDSVESDLLNRMGMDNQKIDHSNPRVLLACLPSLSRLRGHLSTRWFAPSQCPRWYRP